jgi:MYXO-CTERM domain-containing protein
VADAFGSAKVKDGDVVRVLSGGYMGDFDTGTKVLTIEPGNSPGIVDVFGNMFVRPNSTVNFEIGGYNSGLSGGNPQFDQFIVTGNVNFEGVVEITQTQGFMPSLGDSFAIIQSGGSMSFTGTTVLPSLSGGLSWQVAVVSGSSEFGASGHSMVASVVPAPGAAALVGLAGLVSSRRRRA